MLIDIPENQNATVIHIFVEIQGVCGHTWSLDISDGVFVDGWYVCRICRQPHSHKEYQYTKVLSKYPYLNNGMQR